MTDDWFQRMLDIHTVVPFRTIRAAAPYFRDPAKKEREQGIEVFRKIVNVSSVSGTMGNAGQANYSSAKSAVVGLTKTLAKEWGQFKVNVNAVAFGHIETRLTAAKTDENTMGRNSARARTASQSPPGPSPMAPPNAARRDQHSHDPAAADARPRSRRHEGGARTGAVVSDRGARRVELHPEATCAKP